MERVRGEGPAALGRVPQFPEQVGIPTTRTAFLGPARDQRQCLERCHGVDIALDTFPYTGTTTTCESMWMGVPTVTLAGDRGISRSGVTLLSAVGLERCIAATPQRYVAAAIELAQDIPALSALRSAMRQKMENSPLMDYGGLARRIEHAYRGMCMEWCEKSAGENL
jgi:protein O-GlcNAc transferase